MTLGAYNSRNDRRNLFSQTDLIVGTGTVDNVGSTMTIGGAGGNLRLGGRTPFGVPGGGPPGRGAAR